MVLTVEITRLDGADGEELFKSDFNEDDARRLTALERMVREHGWDS